MDRVLDLELVPEGLDGSNRSGTVIFGSALIVSCMRRMGRRKKEWLKDENSRKIFLISMVEKM